MPKDGLHPDPTSDEEINLLTIQLRLEAVKEATKRGRLAFLVSTVASLAILITVWNAYASWNRFIPLSENGAFPKTEVTQAAQKELLAEWVRSQTISVGLLGIRVIIFDAAFLGSISVFVISIWFFYSLRRANRTIGFLLSDTREEGDPIKNLIYHGVVNHLIFAETNHGEKDAPKDVPIRSLDEALVTTKVTLFLRYSYQALFFLPFLAILSIVVGDMLSLLLLDAPFREGTSPILEEMKKASVLAWLKLIFMQLVALFLTYETLKLCWKSLEFERGTGKILKQYYDSLHPEPS